MDAVVMAAGAALRKVIWLVVASLLVDVVLFDGVDWLTAARTASHRRWRSQQPRQRVTVWPISNRWTSGESAVFRNDSRNSPMNGGARSYRVPQ